MAFYFILLSISSRISFSSFLISSSCRASLMPFLKTSCSHVDSLCLVSSLISEWTRDFVKIFAKMKPRSIRMREPITKPAIEIRRD